MARLQAGTSLPSLALAGQRLRLAILLTFVILVGELLGGYFANSLALLADAGHIFADLFALSLSLFAVRQMQRPSDRYMTFGYHRVGVLVALINALTLLAITGAIFWGAANRFRDPPDVEGGLTLGVAAIGLAVNGVVMGLLWQHRATSLNVRSAFLHVAGDFLGSMAVILSAVVILATAWFWVDPIASVIIGGIIAFGAWRIIREGVAILMEAAPAELNVEEVAMALVSVPGVEDVHDLHVWSIAPGLHALSCHVRMEDQPISQGDEILMRVNDILSSRFSIAHSTIQMETLECDPNALFCCLPMNQESRRKRGSSSDRSKIL
jgi:cobalt-zinc-cadmium efflux system protein